MVEPSILRVAVKDLIPYANNSRLHSDDQVNQIASSIKEFGFLNPIIIDAEKGIIAGHGRVMACNKLGIKEVPCIDASHLTEAQKKAYVIADNKIALNSDWDVDLLRVELEGLKELDFDLELTGFNTDELDDLLSVDLLEYEEDADGEVIEPPPEPKTKEGDVWILGKHRLMCGDSTSIDAVEKLMDGEKADLVFTDPPYGVSYSNGMNDKFDVIKNDDVILDIAPVIYSFMKDDTAAFIWTSHHVYPQWREQFESFYKQTLIWYKHGGGIGDLEGSYALDYEIALFCVKGRPKFNGKRGMAVWDIKKDGSSSYVHPTQKPTELSEKGINDFCKQNGRVLDLFGGSGSTLIGCEKTNRKAYLMELDPKYCDVIINRWQTLTGGRAVLESTGEEF